MNKKISLTYYAKVSTKKGVFTAVFRDFNDVAIEGNSRKDVLRRAQELLGDMLIAMVGEGRIIPPPSKRLKGEYAVPVSPALAAPILLNILRNQQRITMTQVAEAMKVPYQQYQRLEQNGNMTLKSLQKAVLAMGARVEIRVHFDS